MIFKTLYYFVIEFFKKKNVLRKSRAATFRQS